MKIIKISYRITNNKIETLENLNDLLNLKNYDNIVWLNLTSIFFTEKFVFPKNLQSIYISKCENLNYLSTLPITTTFIEITKCKINNINGLINSKAVNIETLNLSDNRLEEIPSNLPKNIISLNLSQNDIMRLPLKNCFSPTIQNINLSYNQLQDLPEWFLDINTNTTVTLMPNKFWFNSYTNISLNKVIHDYHIEIARRFFNNSLANKLISTRNISNNVEQRINIQNQQLIIINENNQIYQNNQLNQINGNRTTNDLRRTTAEQAQNVHNSDIQDSFSKSVKIILEKNVPLIENYLDSVFYYYLFDGYNIVSNIYFINHIKNNCSIPDVISRNGVTYGELFKKIWEISEVNEHKKEIRNIIREEISAGMNVCFTGRVTRLVNSLSGFVDSIQIGYSENEQINNAVIATMRRCEKDTTLDLHEEVKKVLDELNIPNDKQQIWLDAL